MLPLPYNHLGHPVYYEPYLMADTHSHHWHCSTNIFFLLVWSPIYTVRAINTKSIAEHPVTISPPLSQTVAFFTKRPITTATNNPTLDWQQVNFWSKIINLRHHQVTTRQIYCSSSQLRRSSFSFHQKTIPVTESSSSPSSATIHCG